MGIRGYELVYAPIPRTGWEFISCVSYDHITADAAQINQETIQLTMFIIVLMLGMFRVIVVMLVFVVRANASREAVRRDRLFTPDDPLCAQCDRHCGDSGTRRHRVRVPQHGTGAWGLRIRLDNAIERELLRLCQPRGDRQAVLELGSARSAQAGRASGSLEHAFYAAATRRRISCWP
ncbi:MAG: hypothetical protein ACLSAC_29510 [Enterocloster bolteae]